MSIPYSSTTIQVLRSTDDVESDGYEARQDESYLPTGSPVRAHFSVPKGTRGQGQDGDVSQTTLDLICDPISLEGGDRIRDVVTGREYEVQWAHPHNGPMPYIKSFVKQVDRIS